MVEATIDRHRDGQTVEVPETLTAEQRDAVARLLETLGDRYLADDVAERFNWTEADSIIDFLVAFGASRDSDVVTTWLEGDAEERALVAETAPE